MDDYCRQSGNCGVKWRHSTKNYIIISNISDTNYRLFSVK